MLTAVTSETVQHASHAAAMLGVSYNVWIVTGAVLGIAGVVGIVEKRCGGGTSAATSPPAYAGSGAGTGGNSSSVNGNDAAANSGGGGGVAAATSGTSGAGGSGYVEVGWVA